LLLSQRPSRIIEELPIDFPRPRNQIITRAQPRFMEIRNRIYQRIRNESALS
jgi:NitT/TauT family transport system ATP-binding protein